MGITEIRALAASVWNETKAAEDPEFDGCALNHRENLLAITDGVVKTGFAETAFEKAVAAKLAEQKADTEAEVDLGARVDEGNSEPEAAKKGRSVSRKGAS